MIINLPTYKIILSQEEADLEKVRLQVLKKQIENINLMLIEKIEDLNHFTKLQKPPCLMTEKIYSDAINKTLKIKADLKRVFNYELYS